MNSGYLIYKAYPDSPDKIDAAYAAVMAWKARLDAVAKGVGQSTSKGSRVIVLRYRRISRGSAAQIGKGGSRNGAV